MRATGFKIICSLPTSILSPLFPSLLVPLSLSLSFFFSLSLPHFCSRVRIHFYASFTALSRSSFWTTEGKKGCFGDHSLYNVCKCENYRGFISINGRECDLLTTISATGEVATNEFRCGKRLNLKYGFLRATGYRFCLSPTELFTHFLYFYTKL